MGCKTRDMTAEQILKKHWEKTTGVQYEWSEATRLHLQYAIDAIQEALDSKPKADSTTIIGDVQEHYNELTKAGYEFDYKSFYNGWIEGRAKLLVKSDKA